MDAYIWSDASGFLIGLLMGLLVAWHREAEVRKLRRAVIPQMMALKARIARMQPYANVVASCAPPSRPIVPSRTLYLEHLEARDITTAEAFMDGYLHSGAGTEIVVRPEVARLLRRLQFPNGQFLWCMSNGQSVLAGCALMRAEPRWDRGPKLLKGAD